MIDTVYALMRDFDEEGEREQSRENISVGRVKTTLVH